MKNRLKQMLKQGKVAIGTEITINHPDVAEAIGQIGYDWVMIDTEHAPLDVGDVQNLLQAMGASQIVPVARVTWNDFVLVKRLLDVGVQGIIFPWINSKEEATKAVQSMKYPPFGVRGVGPRRAGTIYPDYMSTANKELFIGVQIESQRAVDNLDEILSVQGIDAALLGAGDMTMNMGIFGDLKSPKFIANTERIAEVCKRHNVAAGQLGCDDVGKRVSQGYTILNRRNDIGLLVEEAARSLAEAREAASR